MKSYYFFGFPLEMFGIAFAFGAVLLAIVYAANRRSGAGRRKKE